MDALLVFIALILVAVTLFAVVRYSASYLHGTFTAWGAKHYAEKSGQDQDQEQ